MSTRLRLISDNDAEMDENSEKFISEFEYRQFHNRMSLLNPANANNKEKRKYCSACSSRKKFLEGRGMATHSRYAMRYDQ